MHKKKFKKKIIKWSVQRKLLILKLVPKLKTNKPLKLLLADVKPNSTMILRLEMVEIAQNK